MLTLQKRIAAPIPPTSIAERKAVLSDKARALRDAAIFALDIDSVTRETLTDPMVERANSLELLANLSESLRAQPSVLLTRELNRLQLSSSSIHEANSALKSKYDSLTQRTHAIMDEELTMQNAAFEEVLGDFIATRKIHDTLDESQEVVEARNSTFDHLLAASSALPLYTRAEQWKKLFRVATQGKVARELPEGRTAAILTTMIHIPPEQISHESALFLEHFFTKIPSWQRMQDIYSAMSYAYGHETESAFAALCIMSDHLAKLPAFPCLESMHMLRLATSFFPEKERNEFRQLLDDHTQTATRRYLALGDIADGIPPRPLFIQTHRATSKATDAGSRRSGDARSL